MVTASGNSASESRYRGFWQTQASLRQSKFFFNFVQVELELELLNDRSFTEVEAETPSVSLG